MTDLRECPTPLFGCKTTACAEEVSYEANMLRLHDGGLICEGCYDEEFLDDGSLPWDDLPKFIYRSPLPDKLITALEESNEVLADLVYGPKFHDDLETRRSVRGRLKSNRALIKQAREK